MTLETYYVYGLINETTNDLFYVGSSMNPKQRFIQHKVSLPLQVRQGFRMEILEEANCYNKTDIEGFWIQSMTALGCNLINRNKHVSSYRRFLSNRPGISAKSLLVEG